MYLNYRNNQQIINSTLPVPYNENTARSSSIVSLGREGNRLPLIVKGNQYHSTISFSIIESYLIAIHFSLNSLHLFVDRDTEAGRSQPNRPRSRRSWFQCYLGLGLVGFVTFWLVLMLRVYLHEKYWTWSYIW